MANLEPIKLHYICKYADKISLNYWEVVVHYSHTPKRLYESILGPLQHLRNDHIKVLVENVHQFTKAALSLNSVACLPKERLLKVIKHIDKFFGEILHPYAVSRRTKTDHLEIMDHFIENIISISDKNFARVMQLMEVLDNKLYPLFTYMDTKFLIINTLMKFTSVKNEKFGRMKNLLPLWLTSSLILRR